MATMIHYPLLIFLHIMVLLPANAFPPASWNNDHRVGRQPASHCIPSTQSRLFYKLSKADEERLLLSEPAMTAFIVAEMRQFLTSHTHERLTIWELSDQEKLQLHLIDDQGAIIDVEYQAAKKSLTDVEAINWLCNATQDTFVDGYTNEQGLMSSLGSAILFFKQPFRGSPKLLAACEHIGLSDYAVAHHITDMYHHRYFRGAYTKTLAPSGEGEIAARLAVGLEDNRITTSESNDHKQSTNAVREDDMEDECLVLSPTTPGVCLHSKSDEEAWRKNRFERIQMEGFRDPRRGNSGTTR